MKKIIALSVIWFSLMGCSVGKIAENNELNAKAANSIPEAWIAYFQCRYTAAISNCRQAAWSKYPDPDLGHDLNRKSSQQYIAAMEMLGARQVLTKSGKVCPAVIDLNTMLFADTLAVVCSNGAKFNIGYVGNEWIVTEQNNARGYDEL